MLILAACFSGAIRLFVAKTTIYLRELELLEKTLHKCMTATTEINTLSHSLTADVQIFTLLFVRSREFKLNNRCKRTGLKKDPKPHNHIGCIGNSKKPNIYDVPFHCFGSPN